MRSISKFKTAICASVLGAFAVSTLTACSPYLGVGIPVGPFSVGVGVGRGGVSAGVGTGVGPVGVGVGVNQSGQVTGNAGVGVGTSVGGANVGVGVGTGTVLYDPARPSTNTTPQAVPDGAPEPGVVVPVSPAPAPASPGEGDMQWRGANGQTVPECRINNRC